MSRIDELIAEFCPDGVEIRALGEIADLVRGNGMPKAVLTDSGVGAIHYGQIYTHYGAWTTATLSCVSTETAARLAKANPGDLIITNTSENLEDVGKAVAWLGTQPIVTGGHATVIRHREDPKFLSYWFQTASFAAQKRALASGTKVIDVSARQLAKALVPVPPLEVQREIVRILDTFTELEAELKAELEARRHQYEHYRDSLLTRAREGCDWLTLRDVSTEFGRGKSMHRPRNDPGLYGGRYPFIQTGDVRNAGHQIATFSQTYNEAGLAQSKLWPEGTICITIAANIAETGILILPACFPDSIIGLVVDPAKASPGFVEYLLQSFRVELASQGQGSAQSNINLATFERQKFPFPSLPDQERIVEALDKFNDLSVGLPAEIAARRRQYEYYRDKLLTFEEFDA